MANKLQSNTNCNCYLPMLKLAIDGPTLTAHIVTADNASRDVSGRQCWPVCSGLNDGQSLLKQVFMV